MEIYEFNVPSEKNGYCLFDQEIENNPLILFHTTRMINTESIIRDGFKHGQDLESVSYAHKSSTCLFWRGQNVVEDYVVFVVEFETLDRQGIVVNNTDIHVYSESIQPYIKGYCVIPKEYIFR